MNKETIQINTKKNLRTKILKYRKQIVNNGEEILNDNQKIIENIKPLISNYNKILIYYPIFNEPNILTLLDMYKDKMFYLPYTYPDHIEIRKIVDINDLEKDLYNVPSSKIKTDDCVEVAIVPAVAMNNKKYRLGYGKGYYDKFLQNKNILKIAVVNSKYLVDIDYQDEWDISFDIIVTEKEVIK